MGNEIKILIFSKKGTSKGKTFFNYRTRMNLIVKGQEGKGLQKKTVDVRFRQTAKIPDKVIGKDYLRGILTCDSLKVDAPTIYAIKETTNDDGDVILKYPAVWVSEVISYSEQEREAKQSAFDLEDEPESETTEEPETEETEETDLGGSDD